MCVAAAGVGRVPDGGVVVRVSQATDSKKEAFRKFLETAGVIDMLTKCAWQRASAAPIPVRVKRGMSAISLGGSQRLGASACAWLSSPRDPVMVARWMPLASTPGVLQTRAVDQPLQTARVRSRRPVGRVSECGGAGDARVRPVHASVAHVARWTLKPPCQFKVEAGTHPSRNTHIGTVNTTSTCSETTATPLQQQLPPI